MKQPLLLSLFIFYSFSVCSQVQGPPPCGLTPAYACDDDNDGFAIFNLVDLFSFETFCRIDKGEPEEYLPIVYYASQEDSSNETNPIVNPEAYTNTSNSQMIYYRANKIVPDHIEFLFGENPLEVKRLLTNIPDLVVYDSDSDGLSTFDLTSVNIFCGSNDKNDYALTFYLSQTDADSATNQIVNPEAFSNTTNPQIIFVRVEHNTSNYEVVTSFSIKALFAEANNPGDVEICSETIGSGYDLTQLNNVILGDQSPDNFTISYYSTASDAENQINDFYLADVIESRTFYARVQENNSGSYAITSFTVRVLLTPNINQPTSLELCDDEIPDGLTIFDLSSKTPEIIGGLTNVSVSYYSDVAMNVIVNNNFYINTAPYSQTIYVKVEDMINGCYSMTSLELIVQDCSTKGVIEVNAFHDANSDTIFDNDETSFLNGTLTYVKNNDGIQHVLYSSNGMFNIISDDENNTYDIVYSLLAKYDTCYNITTFLYNDISVANGDTVNYNFPITKTQECGDVAVYLASYAPPRPGFNYYNRLIIKNKSLETVSSGTIEFIQDPLVTFNEVTNVSSGYTVNNTATGFTLDFVDLKPNEQQTVIVNMNVPVATSLGTLLTNTATYSVVDSSIENNTSVLSETVIGSYDPNDIAESHGPDILYSDFGNNDYLYYTVRFQNVGTADAINVSIDNTLNAKLDKGTIQMLSASHDYVFRRTDDQLNWKFDNIHLPSEDMDEPNSHGYVYYKIRPLAGYNVGDIIPNTAEIYFDFNPAVITNTFNTEFITTLSNKKFNEADFFIFPNPATEIVELRFNKSINDIINVSVYNIQGKLILNSKKALQNNTIPINVSSLENGIYFLKVNDGISEITKKLIIK